MEDETAKVYTLKLVQFLRESVLFVLGQNYGNSIHEDQFEFPTKWENFLKYNENNYLGTNFLSKLKVKAFFIEIIPVFSRRNYD